MLPDFFQNLQGFFVANTGKRIQTRTIGLAVGAFKEVGNLESSADAVYFFGNFKGDVLPFNGARASNEEEIATLEVLQIGLRKHKFTPKIHPFVCS
jgi:hypothetical protein